MNIYTGFRVALSTTIENLAILNTAAAGVQKAATQKAVRIATRTLVEKADNFCAQRHLVRADRAKPADESWMSVQDDYLLESVIVDQLERQAKCRASSLREPTVDCDVTLYLRFHPDTGDVLGHCQEEKAGAMDWLTSQRSVEEFGYWASGERPRHIPVETWEARGRAWKRVMSANNVCLTNTTRPGTIEASDVARALPTLAERASRLAKHRLIDAAIHSKVPVHDTEMDASARMRLSMRVLMNTQEEITTPGTLMHAEFQALQDRYLRILPPDLTPYLDKKLRDLP